MDRKQFIVKFANARVNWDVEELESKREEIVSKNLLKVLPVL
jgi:hypothetical protein